MTPPQTVAEPATRKRGLRALWGAAGRGRDASPTGAPPAPPESLFGALVGADSRTHDSNAHDSQLHESHLPSATSAEGRSPEARALDADANRDPRVVDLRERSTAAIGQGDVASAGSINSGTLPSRPPGANAKTIAASPSLRDAASKDGESASLPAEDESAARRLYRVFVGARAVLGAALVAALVAGGMLGMRAPLSTMLVAMAYATQAVVLWMLPRFRQDATDRERLTRGQWVATIGVDLATFALLHTMQPTHNFNFVALLLLPVLTGGLLASRTMALAGTSAVVLFVLAVTWRTVDAGADPAASWMQAGLAGAGFFAVTLLAGEMASRLASQTRAARSGLELARQQARLNRLVIEEMTDGVLVVDRRGRVRAANPAARRLLVPEGLGRAAPFHLQDDGAWADLQHWVQQAFARKASVLGESSVTLKFQVGATRTLRVRTRFTRRGAPAWPTPSSDDLPSEQYAVLFLEDQRLVLDRNRQEKLAAMGRVSAGIAHEIRNPLAAIAQANALLAEEAQGPEQRMLTRMVGENVERLKLIVDDVMAVAPSRAGDEPVIDAVSAVARIVGEWAHAAGLAIDDGTRLRVELAQGTMTVEFDIEHLRRVLVNLLDNARRHASDAPGAIVVRLSGVSKDRPMLSVASDGEPIGPDVEPYLFEPFFSSRSRGTGLGLYICRELCERYGASIDYWQQPPSQRHRNEFRVVFRAAEPRDPRKVPVAP